MPTIMLVISWAKATGAQIRSILLGVIVFKTVPILKKATTNHIPILENGNSCGKIKSALDNTITAIKHNTSRLMTATTLIFGGYFPGYLPPKDASPQGTPAAKHPWKIITNPVKMVKMTADTVTSIIFFFLMNSKLSTTAVCLKISVIMGYIS
jgi:hypothetical protein